MKVYYIIMHTGAGEVIMFHLGLFPWIGAAQDYIDLKLNNPINIALGRTYSIGETFVNEPDEE